jgi:hypothetical protein
MIVMIFLFFILFNFPPFYIGQALTPSTLYKVEHSEAVRMTIS